MFRPHLFHDFDPDLEEHTNPLTRVNLQMTPISETSQDEVRAALLRAIHRFAPPMLIVFLVLCGLSLFLLGLTRIGFAISFGSGILAIELFLVLKRAHHISSLNKNNSYPLKQAA